MSSTLTVKKEEILCDISLTIVKRKKGLLFSNSSK